MNIWDLWGSSLAGVVWYGWVAVSDGTIYNVRGEGDPQPLSHQNEGPASQTSDEEPSRIPHAQDSTLFRFGFKVT